MDNGGAKPNVVGVGKFRPPLQSVHVSPSLADSDLDFFYSVGVSPLHFSNVFEFDIGL